MTSQSEKTGPSDVSIVLCGAAGQGLQTIEKVLAGGCRAHGLHVCTSKSYMSRVRGGTVHTTIRIGSDPVQALTRRIDLLVPFTAESVMEISPRLTSGTVMLLDPNLGMDTSELPCEVIPIPIMKTAMDIGNRLYANAVAAGVLGTVMGLDVGGMAERGARLFAGKPSEVARENRDAVKAGGKLIPAESPVCSRFRIGKGRSMSRVMLNGSQGVGLGALAGGCRLLAAYPMSPGTGVLSFLAGQAERFGLVVEQVEDEIAALNMAIGASFAGARSMVTTSGGGFALMTEAVSLAAMTETPVVIHVAQRPGPATGLPTRTEQADLDLVLHAGHGEFSRVIYAPGSPEEAIRLTQTAFDVSGRYQVPAFVLTDQYLVDTAWDVIVPEVQVSQPMRDVVEATRDYQRYRLTEDGISPRAIPGLGEGVMVASGNEHDEEGHPTEESELRNRMNEKRLVRSHLLASVAIMPSIDGPADAEWAIVCWGSTGPVVREAMTYAGLDGRLFHFGQVFPVAPAALGLLKGYERIVVVEQNATGQFERLLAGRYGIVAHGRIHKTDGRPFLVEDLAHELSCMLSGGTT